MLSYKETRDILDKEYPEYSKFLDPDMQARNLLWKDPKDFEKVLIRNLANSTDAYIRWNEVKGLVDTANGLNKKLLDEHLELLSSILKKKPELMTYIKDDFPEVIKELENMKNNLEEKEAPFEGKRVPEDKIRENGYQYFSTHGLGPGTVPKDVCVRELDIALPSGWVTFKTDRPLTSEELVSYDIQPETKNSYYRKKFNLEETEEQVVKSLRDDNEGLLVDIVKAPNNKFFNYYYSSDKDHWDSNAGPFNSEEEAIEMANKHRPTVKEAEEDTVENTNIDTTDDFQVYMNTWKNYNEYGADLEAYGIKDGWMNIDQAIEFCNKYAEDEPFINDVDNSTGLEIEVSEYDNAPTKLAELKDLFDKYDSLSSDEQDAVKAILEANGDDDINNAIDIAESGDYIFLPDVDNEADLARAYIDMCGGIEAAVPKDRIMDFIDADSIKEGWQDDINSQYEEGDPDWYEVDDYMVQEDIESVLGSGNRQAIDNFIDQYFDYESFGDELSYDYTFVDGGAISIY